MIFKPELVRAIQQGKKTMTRRPIMPGEQSCRYKERHLYSVKRARTGKTVLQITVLEVRPEPLGRLTLEDARREGFRTTAAFFDYWHRLYGPTVSAGVRDMEKRLADLDPESETARAYTVSIEESRRRRGERLPLPAIPCAVWVISFARGDLRDSPRLLRASAPEAPVCKAPLRDPAGKVVYKPGGRKRAVLCNRAFDDDQMVCACGAFRPDKTGEDHGYTSRTRQAMSDEPEAISLAEQEKLAKAARKGEAQLSLKPWRDRKERLEREARGLRSDLAAGCVAHREVQKQLNLLDKALRSIGDLLEHAA